MTIHDYVRARFLRPSRKAVCTRRSLLGFLVIVGTAAFLIGHAPIPQLGANEHSYWPTTGWRNSTPEEQGMDSALLADMILYIQNHNINLHGVSIIRHGYVVTDAYAHPYAQGTKHIVHSCAKSIISTLIGIAIDKGYIKSVNQTILEIFPERTIANLDSRKRAMTLEHVLTMTSGLYTRDSGRDGYLDMRLMAQSEDWVQYVLDLPMFSMPGTRFLYSNCAALLLSGILQESEGMNALAFAKEYLFDPLGISDVEWLSSPQGVTLGYGKLWLTPHDMAKIGYLYLRNGVWDGKQVVSSMWVNASTAQIRSDTPTGEGYGYQWWVGSAGGYRALGYAGQRIIVLPDQDMVVVFTGGLPNESVLDSLLSSYIIPAAVSSIPLPSNPDGVELLQSRINTLGNPEPEPIPPLPEMAQNISGTRYVLPEAIHGFDSFALNFYGQEASITLHFDGDPVELPIGLDDIYRMTPLDPPAFAPLLNASCGSWDIDALLRSAQVTDLTGSLAMKGFWQNENVFVIYEQIVGLDDRTKLTMTFDKTGVTLEESALVRAVPPAFHITRGFPYLCDVNGDKQVNMRDIASIARIFGSSIGNAGYKQAYDLDKNGAIDMTDMVIVATNFGKTY